LSTDDPVRVAVRESSEGRRQLAGVEQQVGYRHSVSNISQIDTGKTST